MFRKVPAHLGPVRSDTIEVVFDPEFVGGCIERDFAPMANRIRQATVTVVFTFEILTFAVE
jgi:hypothetical protein